MTYRGFVSLGVAAVILAAALPAAAEPGTPATPLRASIDRALDAPAPVSQAGPQAKSSGKTRRAQGGGTNTGGGGGSSHMILALLGTAISVGATIFIVKEMQKNEPVPPPAFR